MLRIRTKITASLGGGPYLSTAYFILGDAQADADAAVAAIGAFWTAVDNQMDSTYAWATEAEVTVMTTAGVVTGVLSTTPQVGSGSAVGDPLPLASQGLIRWTTNGFPGGRRLRGRTFVPGAVNSLTLDGRPTAAYRTALKTAADALVAADGGKFAIWSKTNSSAYNVATTSVWTEWAVLRSRRDS